MSMHALFPSAHMRSCIAGVSKASVKPLQALSSLCFPVPIARMRKRYVYIVRASRPGFWEFLCLWIHATHDALAFDVLHARHIVCGNVN